MEYVFVVHHVHNFDDGSEDVKLIGIYQSRDCAEMAIKRLSRKAGFRDAKDGFSIDKYKLDKDQWVEGYATITDC